MTFSTRYIYASRKKGIFCLKLWAPRQICERQPFVFCWEYQNVASNHGGICYRSWFLSSRVRSDTTPRTSILASCAGSNLSFVPRTKHFCFVWWRVILLLCCQILVGLLPNWQDQCGDPGGRKTWCGPEWTLWFSVVQCGRITWCGPVWTMWTSVTPVTEKHGVDQCGRTSFRYQQVRLLSFTGNNFGEGGMICVGHKLDFYFPLIDNVSWCASMFTKVALGFSSSSQMYFGRKMQ